MKKLNNKLAQLAGLSMLVSTTAAFAGQASTQSVQVSAPEYVTDRLIVKYKSSNQPVVSGLLNGNVSAAVQKRMSDRVKNLGDRIGRDFKMLRKMSTGESVVKLQRFQTKTELANMISQLQMDPEVDYVEPDYMMHPLATPNDSRYNEQWHYFESTGGLNLPTAWDTTTGSGVVVAVLDTGYVFHSDLDANIIGGYDMISDDFVGRDNQSGRDSDASDPGDWTTAGECYSGSPAQGSSWHGTHVAGTIAAVSNNGTGVAGVAYGAKVVPVRVLGRCGGYTSDIADGIIWAAGGSVSGVPSNPNPAQVINMSLGGSGACGSTTQNAINTARSLGATVIVAAGNSNTNASNANPANCSGVVTVASTDRSGGRAYYSNYGSVVDVAAPGGETNAGASNGVLSTLNSGSTTPSSQSYAFYQGTSMATPHVAGVAALMYAVKPSITPDEVESTLKSTSRSFPSSCSQCGSGIVDAAAAVAAANGGSGGGGGGGSTSDGFVETNLSGSRNQWKDYTLEVPAGSTLLEAIMSGGSGDADLYVRYGSYPQTNAYDCRPYKSGNNESCSFNNPQAGTWYISIRGYSNYSGVRLEAEWTK